MPRNLTVIHLHKHHPGTRVADAITVSRVRRSCQEAGHAGSDLSLSAVRRVVAAYCIDMHYRSCAEALTHVSKTWGGAPRAEIAGGRAGARRSLAAARRGGPGLALPFTRLWLVSRPVGDDAVVGAACSGAAGAGAVAAQHLRGGPAVQLHQVSLGPPRSSQVWLKWCRNRCVQASTPACLPRPAIIW